MYRRPKFLEVLLEIRRQMAVEADYDVDLFTEIARSGVRPHAVLDRVNHRRPRTKRSRNAETPELSRSRKG